MDLAGSFTGPEALLVEHEAGDLVETEGRTLKPGAGGGAGARGRTSKPTDLVDLRSDYQPGSAGDL